MAAKKKDPEQNHPEPKPSLEVFENQKMLRSELKKAPYNPRRISEKNRLKLKKGILKVGIVTPACVFNKRTGNICGGHRRLDIMDAYHGGEDYYLTVSVVDVSPKREREINLLLNNREAQGEDDLEKLEAIIASDNDGEGKIEFEAAGYDTADMYRMFGDKAFDRSNAKDLKELGDKLASERQKHAGIVEGNEDRDNPRFYMVVVFPGQAKLIEFLEKHNLGDDYFVAHEAIEALIRPSSPRTPD